MTIKSRIILLIVQLALLLGATFLVSQKFAVNEIWFFSGLLAIVINPILLEPWYPKSYDTLGNSIIALILCFIVEPNIASIGWVFLKVFLSILIAVAILQLVYNATKEKDNNLKLKTIFPLFTIGKASIIYSLVFWLAVIESFPNIDNNFWILAACWALLTFTRLINWEQYFLEVTDKPVPVSPIGIIGPSTLLVTSRSIAEVGTPIKIITGSISVKGTIVKKINRTDDTWAQIQLSSGSQIGWLVSRSQLKIEIDSEEDERKQIGNVDEGTNTNILVFDTNENIKIGDTVYIENYGKVIFYQIYLAEIYKFNIKSGSQLDRRIKAIQIGNYNIENQTLQINNTLPSPSEPIYMANNEKRFTEKLKTIYNKFTIGKIKNSALPINIDLSKLMESHMAILGMTGMGKTTLCNLLIKELSKIRRVTVLDQSGEFVSKLGYAKYQDGDDNKENGVSVCEPTGIPAQSALKYLNHLMALAKNEYQAGTPKPRVLVIDEAHQFIPEPAGMGFNTTGREESMKFGLNMMQIRKYGISIIFISQRTAVVSKSALSQCENLIAFKSVDQTGLDYLEGILGYGSKELLPTLSRGEALVYGPAIDIEKSLVINTIK
jgi:hypothetical protein